MTAVLPRTIRAVDTERLMLREEEATRLGLSQRLPVEWLREHVETSAVHYLRRLTGGLSCAVWSEARCWTGAATA